MFREKTAHFRKIYKFAGVAQLARALPCHGRGRGFESHHSRIIGRREAKASFCRIVTLKDFTLLTWYPFIMKRTRAVGVIVHNSNVLLIERRLEGKAYYVFPGGGVEEGEKIEDAVLRELYEETTIKASIQKLIYHFNYLDQDSEHFFYLCNYIEGTAQLGKGNEKKEMEAGTAYYKPLWFPIEKLAQTTIYPTEARNWLIADIKNNFVDEVKSALIRKKN